MRFLLFFIVFISYCLPSKEQTPNSKAIFKTNGQFEIQGRIKNYTPLTNNQIITFRTYDIQGRSKDTVVIPDKDGLFNLSLFQSYSGNIEMNYDKAWLTLYIPSVKKVGLEINNSTWSSDQSKSGSLKMSGEAGIITPLILDFKNALKKEVFKTTVNWEDSSLNDETVAAIRITRMKEELSFLKNYTNKNKITNTKFINWAKNEILYTAGFDIAFTSFISSRKKSLTDQQLMKILKDIPLTNQSAVYNSSYYNFVSVLAMDLVIIININPIYKDVAKPYGMNAIPVYLKKIDSYSTALAKELMYYTVYFRHPQNKTDYYLENFQNVIKEPYLKKLFAENKEKFLKPFEPFDLVNKLQEYKVHDSLKTRLIDIFNSERNNNVFIDFWGDWCMPCMKEMPHYSQFIDQFKEIQPSFLFFAVKTDEKSSLEVKNKYSINGNFIVLNDIEENIMRNVLQFSGYPAHFVLRPGSLVVDNTISKITSGGSQLDKNIVEKVRKHFSSPKKQF
jgi:thiol-disulfide isomerase/thioredoxin